MDTVVALATPEGHSALAVLRLSGAKALDIVSCGLKGLSLQAKPSHTLHVCTLYDGDSPIDEVVLALYKAPRSYTGEDLIEIFCHGSPFIVHRLLTCLCRWGAKMATAGAFTKRAFLNKKIDLMQAEAISDLIAAEAQAAANNALRHLKGQASKQIDFLRTQVSTWLALVELSLDFSEEDVNQAHTDKLMAQGTKVLQVATQLKGQIAIGKAIRQGLVLVLVGKPNAGKSTLLNALAGQTKALVSDVPGTTRDAIEVKTLHKGIVLRWVDTAGLRHKPQSKLERQGLELTQTHMQNADALVWIVDAKRTKPNTLDKDAKLLRAYQKPLLLVANKNDLLSPKARTFWQTKQAILLSAQTKEGLERLTQAIETQCLQSPTLNKEAVVLTSARHYDACLLYTSDAADE